VRPAGIPTKFQGIQFRSRLEAKWAAFFKNIGIIFEYEPFDAAGYIPDFLLMGSRPLLVEVKPLQSIQEMVLVLKRTVRKCAAHWQGDIIILGVSPEIQDKQRNDGWESWQNQVAGLMAEDSFPDQAALSDRYAIGIGRWFMCGMCEKINILHSMMSYDGRPCGHWMGRGHVGALSPLLIHAPWREAHNETQWNPA
jgi:hypothetical protein